MTAGADALDADRSELAAFARAVLVYADDGTYVSLRTFGHNAGDPPIDVRAVQLNGDRLAELIEAVFRQASRAARHPQPTVFCPPICTLTNAARAREEDLANGLALSVEIDANAKAGLARLRGVIGPPTVVVASGGSWTDPASGETQPKLHGHWRLSEATRDPEEHSKLKRARRLATALVGGDATNIPAVHPIRWPGSVHRKGEPKLCCTVEFSEDAEIDLAEALEALEVAAVAHGIGLADTAHSSGNGEHRETAALIAEIMSGRAYVAPLTALSARYAGGGMTKAKIAETLEGLMQAVPLEARDGGQPRRWRSRYAGIGRMAASAVRKFGPKPEQADKPGADPRPEETPPEPPPQRPLVRLRGGGLAEHAAAAQKALAAEAARAPMTGVYVRGSLLVRPVRLQSVLESGGIRRAAGALQLLAADGDYLRLELTRIMHLQKFNTRTEEWRDVDAPEALARSVLAAVPWPAMPPLTGIIEAPTLRLDGTLLDRPGYDQATGLLFDPGDTRFEPIAARPTRQEALAALATLHEVLEGFPFAKDKGEGSATAARSVAISAMITATCRREPWSARWIRSASGRKSARSTSTCTRSCPPAVASSWRRR